MPHRILLPRLPILLVSALVAILVLLVASPASAHDELISTDPAADSTVDGLPAQLTFTFSDEIEPTEGASEVQVTDAAGTTLAAGSPTAQDNVLTQPLEGEASGVVTVLWKVVSSDGHPISGEFAFTVTPAATPTPEPTESATATPTPDETAVTTPSPSATPEESGSTNDALPWIIGGLILLAVVAAVTYLLVSRARRQRDAEALEAGSEPPADR